MHILNAKRAKDLLELERRGDPEAPPSLVIVVDEFACTSDPDIVAAGDCTNHPSQFAGRNIRLESVQNAMEQGRIAARSLMGKREAYQNVPWFWSDQYDLKLQMVGLSQGYDQLVLRGDPANQRNFAAFYLREGRMIAADAISRPAEFMLAKQLGYYDKIGLNVNLVDEPAGGVVPVLEERVGAVFREWLQTMWTLPRIGYPGRDQPW